jgi:hypothetical protein
VGTTQVTCTATDGSGNSSPSCSFNVTVNDITSTCVLTNPGPIVANSNANACGTNVTYTTPTSDGSGTCGTITCDHASGSFFAVGETLVTCTSSPDGGSTSFTVTVNDTTAPVPDLSSLPTITKDCTANAGVPVIVGGQTVFEPPTATDNCGGSIQGATNDPRVYTDPGTFIVHWTYTDPSGNTSSQDQTINVTGTDTTPPVPDVNPLPTVTGECSATVTDAPTATDDCDGTLTGTTGDPLTYTGVGTYTVHWTYTDQAGHSVQQNQTVVVTDEHAPTIALVGASTITVECHTSFTDPGVTTTDNCVPKNVTVTTTGTVDVNVPNTYTLTYTATDGGGNQASVQRTVIVQDTIAPSITCPQDQNVSNDPGMCSAMVNVGAPTVSDSCDSTPTISGTRSDSQPLNAAYPVGTTTITWTATDDSNNSSSCVQTITVNDTENPTIICPANIILEPTCPSGAIATWTPPVGTDNCPGATTTQTAGGAPGSVFPIGTTTVTYTVNDAHGNSASCSFTVTVKTPQAVIQDLINRVQTLVSQGALNQPQGQGLINQLEQALQALNAGSNSGACGKLNQFINKVQNYIGNGTLTSAQGQPLIDSANHVINTLGCTSNPCT